MGGRNSSAGLINIYTAPPEFDFSAYGAFTYGNYDAIRVEGGINAPLGDTVAARVDGVYFERDGFYNDITNGGTINNRDRYLVRGQLLFEPNDDLSIRLVGDYSKKDGRAVPRRSSSPSLLRLHGSALDLIPLRGHRMGPP